MNILAMLQSRIGLHLLDGLFVRPDRSESKRNHKNKQIFLFASICEARPAIQANDLPIRLGGFRRWMDGSSILYGRKLTNRSPTKLS
jgi:hypothetical protein